MYTKFLFSIVIVAFLVFLLVPINEVSAATAPQPPTGLTSTAVSPTKIVLTWKAPSNNGSSPITGYMIEYKIVPNGYSTLVAKTGNVTNYTHSPVTTGKVYIYRVSAINAIGKSDPSGETVASPTSTSGQTVNTPPNSPTGLTATAVSPTKINLSWNAPTSNGSPAVTGYKIERKVSSGTYSVLVANTGNTTNTYSNTGLSTNTSYTYQVSAINSVGTSNPSSEASAMPTPASAPVATKPYAPTGLTASTISVTQIKLFWQPPSNNGGSPITGYKIEYKNGTNTYSILSSNVGNVTTYIHNGLKTGSTYTYRVSALSSMGTSPTSNEASATPTETLVPTGLVATATSPTSITLSWNAPTQTYGQTISGYRVDQKLSSNVFQTIVDSSKTSSASYTITGLKTGTTYTFVVAAVYSGGTSSNPSKEASATPTNTSSATPPTSSPSTNPPPQTTSVSNPPTGLTTTTDSTTKINLSWTAPSNNGGSLVTGYKIERKVSQNPYFVLVNTNSPITTYSDTDITQGTTYTYRVSAINSVGTSNPSNEASSSVIIVAPPPPPQNSVLNVGTIKVTNTAYNIRYVITGGDVLSSNVDPNTFSLVVKIQTTSDGVLVLPLPRSLIDAKMPNGQNDVFYVLADKKEATFNDDVTPYARTLSIKFPYDTKEITIYGTQVVPEFGSLTLLVLAVAIVSLIFFSTKNRFVIKPK